MFERLPEYFREYGLKADVRTVLILRKAAERGLLKTLGDLFNVLKGIVVHSVEDLGPFTRAYYAFFLDIDIKNGERLNDAIVRSETFKKWREDYLKDKDLNDDLDLDALVDTFLNAVHLTSYDIQQIIDGRELFDNDSGDKEDADDTGDGGEGGERPLDRMGRLFRFVSGGVNGANEGSCR